jgi:hypothetical protein
MQGQFGKFFGRPFVPYMVLRDYVEYDIAVDKNVQVRFLWSIP